jgi:hypothetical protein
VTRDEHLQWAKDRALACLPDEAGAMASFTSDLQKHEELRGHPGLELGYAEALAGFMRTPADVRRWIEGFR